MKFHLIRCDAHGWTVWDAEPPLSKDEHQRLECRGGHFFTADTRNLSVYEADQKHIPDKIGMSDREKGQLLKQSTKIGLN